MAAVTICSDFEAQENKICHSFHIFPFYLHEVMGLDAMILDFLNVDFHFNKEPQTLGVEEGDICSAV